MHSKFDKHVTLYFLEIPKKIRLTINQVLRYKQSVLYLKVNKIDHAKTPVHKPTAVSAWSSCRW